MHKQTSFLIPFIQYHGTPAQQQSSLRRPGRGPVCWRFAYVRYPRQYRRLSYCRPSSFALSLPLAIFSPICYPASALVQEARPPMVSLDATVYLVLTEYQALAVDRYRCHTYGSNYCATPGALHQARMQRTTPGLYSTSSSGSSPRR
jgi:hypothetical protein